MKKFCLWMSTSLVLLFLLQGCFIFSPSSSSSSSNSSSSRTYTSVESSYVNTLCSKTWYLLQGKNEERVYDNNCNYIRTNIQEKKLFTGNTYYVKFSPDNTCVEKGLWGGNGYEKRTWSLKGNKLTIYGTNLTIGEEVGASKVVFTIEKIAGQNLQLKRKIGARTCSSGSEFYRTLNFK